MCKDVHGWTLNDRKPIILNGNGQPIGPDNVTLRQFTWFYGSIARDPDLAPLNFLYWRYVPNKYNIWDYVKKKFIIPEKGEYYVLSSIGALWRTYKSRLKKTHYLPYDNENDRWENRPKTVPDAHFKELQGYWYLEEVKEKADNKPPSEAVMYKETHKRIEGRKYKTSHDDGEGGDEYNVERNMQSMEREEEDCEDS
ncbi:hypothetical protein PHJA_002917800 [Phtheirospermum japonicum]|uniref:Uncharacterized protein n=1 Tax=Phtheirospermum japonicum TaxID=374723 RepID=A0A830D5A1_9LAMI|nr:hypothetical protein PHJA_002917800 [Phtheirospermum japonicum]